jgi:hypothetical protein
LGSPASRKDRQLYGAGCGLCRVEPALQVTAESAVPKLERYGHIGEGDDDAAVPAHVFVILTACPTRPGGRNRCHLMVGKGEGCSRVVNAGLIARWDAPPLPAACTARSTTDGARLRIAAEHRGNPNVNGREGQRSHAAAQATWPSVTDPGSWVLVGKCPRPREIWVEDLAKPRYQMVGQGSG